MNAYAWIWTFFLLGLIQTTVLSNALIVKQIEITGHRKTKEFAILRELDFSIGDTILLDEITLRFERNRTNLLNTALFTDAEFNIREWNNDQKEIIITISVKEAWYIYVIPIIDLADRNFNEWWQEHDRDFNRLNLGISARHINLTGIRDHLKVKGQIGYTAKAEAEYLIPYFNRKKTLGMIVNVLWSSNQEIAFQTRNNKQVFSSGGEDDHPVLERFRVQSGLRYRPNLYMQHELDIGVHFNKTDTSIALQNPDFFLNGNTHQDYLSLRYKATYDERDLQLFPMKGFTGGIEIMKEGFSQKNAINSLYILPFVEYHIPFTQKISLGISGKAQYGVLRDKQPYWNYQGLGYGRDFIRGYELYVMNGLDFVYGKSSLKVQMLEGLINWKRKMPKAFREMPWQLYLTLNYDIGHVNDPFYAENNSLVNHTLSGGGPGLALILYHTFAIQAEYSFNELGENGLFLHTKTSF